MKKIVFLPLCWIVGVLNAFATQPFVVHDRLLSFESEKVPAYIKAQNSVVSTSFDHYKDGKSSLSWKFRPAATLTISKELNFEPKDSSGVDLYLSTFVVWIHNDKPIDGHLTFEFLKQGKVCSSFPFVLNFKGWRAAWVCYERDMEGTPVVGMNQIRITAPKNSAGELCIDHLLTAAKSDPRHQTPDMQVPFVNKATRSHWLVLLKSWNLQPDMPLEELTEEQKSQIAQIEERFVGLIYKPSKLTATDLAAITKAYDRYQIKVQGGKVSGVPIFFARAEEAFERLVPDWKNIIAQRGVEVRSYFDLMQRIAVAYRNAVSQEDQEQLKAMFLHMYAHISDQGIALGSCWGNFTHYGYSFRSLYSAYFLMKDVLSQAGLRQEAEHTLLWYAMTKEVLVAPQFAGIDMDAFNTQTDGRIASILMMEPTPEKLRYLRSFSRWIDFGSRPALGLGGAFKADGGAFHHRNNYPAYAVGGLNGATNMIYLLSQTDFAVSPLAHQTVKDVLQLMRFYCNKEYFPIAMSGRHPDGKGKLIPMHYATMALAGSPDGKQAIDADMAAAYLRFISPTVSSEKESTEYMPHIPRDREVAMAIRLADAGFVPEEDPAGNRALPYGCVSVQRRDNWSAVVRGHSRYLWAAEHYLGANLYGRYLAHGSLQISTAPKGADVSPATSGWQQGGFDWARIPGTTAIELPLDLLRADIKNVDAFSGIEEMLYSDQAFAGGLSQQATNGNFGMVLHEHDKYNGSHRARKSWHFFDSTIVCLGSDIENDNKEYPTLTTLFQVSAIEHKDKAYWERYRATSSNAFVDHLSTGYYVAGPVRLDRKFPQHSRLNSTEAPTAGDWVSLVVDHGRSPKQAGYEYAVVPQTTELAMEHFAKNPPYRVVSRDRSAHIVCFEPTKTTSYVFFETPPADLTQGVVQRVDTSCLVMWRDTEAGAVLTVAQPDLALYRGPSDEAFDQHGKRIERSIYSRGWIDNPSQPIDLTVTIKGSWSVVRGGAVVVIRNKKRTLLRFTCIDGQSQDVVLEKM